MAKGFRQIYGIDYENTFAPVVRLTSLRILLCVAVNKRMDVHDMEVKNAILNSALDHEVCMAQPEGFVDKQNPG